MISAPPRKLIVDIARTTGVKRDTVKRILVATFETIKNEAETGHVMVRGFGTFHTAKRAGCVRPSPSDTSKMIEVPPTKRLALRSAAEHDENA